MFNRRRVLSGVMGGRRRFNPADYGTVALWLKADSLTGYEDEDVVDAWPDSSGNGNDATQGTFIQMPLYIASAINAHPCVRFDGIDDMLAPDVGVTFGPPFTWIAVARLLSAGNFPMLISQDSHNEMRWLSDTGRPEFEPLAAAVTAAGSTTGDWITFEVSASETTAELLVNGVSEGTTGVTSGTRPITIGARAASLFAHMDLAELIMFSEQVSPVAMTALRQELSRKYNLLLS